MRKSQHEVCTSYTAYSSVSVASLPKPATDSVVTDACLTVSPRSSVIERQSLASVLSPSCARPVADG